MVAYQRRSTSTWWQLSPGKVFGCFILSSILWFHLFQRHLDHLYASPKKVKPIGANNHTTPAIATTLDDQTEVNSMTSVNYLDTQTAQVKLPTSTPTTEAQDSTPPTEPVVKTNPRYEHTRKMTKDSAIPKIIHQSWKTREQIPARFAPWIKSWHAMHPNWEYMFWDDQDNLHFFEHHFPKYYHMATQLKPILVADMTRYALLYHYGGVYADTDFESLKPLDELIASHELILSYEPLVHAVLLEGATKPMLCNAILASRPQHPFWLRLLDDILVKYQREFERDPVSLTGPRMLQATVNDLGDDTIKEWKMSLLAEEYFYPEVAYWNMGSLLAKCKGDNQLQAVNEACEWLEVHPHGRHTANTYAVHHWQCTWCRKDINDTYIPLATILPIDQINRPS